MSDALPFATDVLLVATAGVVVLLAHRLSGWLPVPPSLLVLAASAGTVALVPGVHHPSERLVGRIVTVALVAVLFGGGMSIGTRRFRSNLAPILALGVAGTFATAALAGVFVHLAFRLGWYPSLLVATAVSPTDPAVVFSVLGRRRVAGRSGAILEGESGANDPVGIALMTGLIGAGGLSASGVGHISSTFALQMSVGSAIGLAGGLVLATLIRYDHLPGAGLEPIRTSVAAFLVYGAAAVAHGSGYLAVFVAGIVIGDSRAPNKVEIEHFHSALGSLGEMAAFVALGLTVDLHVIARLDVWGVGLILGAALAAVIRPLVVPLFLVRTRMTAAERGFVQFAGLKGAVPILLGSYILGTGLPDGSRLYGIVLVVVAFSVAVQGGLVGPAIRRLRLPLEG